MTFLRLILILAVATSAMGAGEMVELEKQKSMDCCKSKDDCRQEKDAATKLLGVGEAKSDASLDPNDVAACTVFAVTLLNHDAAVMRR